MAVTINKPSNAKFKIEPWQLEDLAHLATRHNEGNKGTANWSEMGTYKTSTLLWLIQRMTESKKAPSVLIVTTPSGKGTYYEAVPALLPGWTLLDINTRGVFYVLPGGKRVKMGDRPTKKIDFPHVILSHYHCFAKTNRGEPKRDKKTNLPVIVDGVMQMLPWTIADHLLDRRYDFVAIDEAHRMKNRTTKWTENLKKLRTGYKHVMTGTGFINRPDEIWSLLNFLDPDEFSSFWRFRDTFCEIDPWDGYEKVVGLKQETKEEFRTLVRTIGARRTLSEVMPHIKEPIFVRREVELSTIQRRMYEEIKAELKMLDQRGTPIHSPNVISALNRMRQICVATPEIVEDRYDEKLDRRIQRIELVEPSSKLDEAMDIINELEWDEDSKQPVVVFSNFRGPLQLLKARLNKAEIPYIHMEQGDSDAVRYHKWFELFPQLNHKVFMSTLQLGSESINLTPARHVIFLDRSWSPKDNSQGIGRIRRPGQEGQPVVINIEAHRTTDQRVEKTNYDKQGWFNEIFGEEAKSADA